MRYPDGVPVCSETSAVSPIARSERSMDATTGTAIAMTTSASNTAFKFLRIALLSPGSFPVVRRVGRPGFARCLKRL